MSNQNVYHSGELYQTHLNSFSLKYCIKERHCLKMKKILRNFISVLLFCIIFGGWYFGSLILIKVDSEEILRHLRFESRNREALQHIDKYCRTIEKQNLNRHSNSNAWSKIKTKKEDALESWMHARREKLIRENLIYFPSLSQMWCLTPKAASTSWSRAIIDQLNGESNNSVVRLNSLDPLQVILRQQFGNIEKQTFTKAALSEKVKKVLLVRHPFARLSSAYLDKLADRKAKSDGMHFFQNFGVKINRMFRQNSKTNKRREPTFVEFVDYLIHTKTIDYDEHWIPISSICGLCHVKYDQIIFTEDLKEFSDLYLEKLGFPKNFKLQKENQLLNGSKNTVEQFLNISSSMKIKLLTKFQDDFRLFQYSFLKHYI